MGTTRTRQSCEGGPRGAWRHTRTHEGRKPLEPCVATRVHTKTAPRALVSQHAYACRQPHDPCVATRVRTKVDNRYGRVATRVRTKTDASGGAYLHTRTHADSLWRRVSPHAYARRQPLAPRATKRVRTKTDNLRPVNWRPSPPTRLSKI